MEESNVASGAVTEEALKIEMSSEDSWPSGESSIVAFCRRFRCTRQLIGVCGLKVMDFHVLAKRRGVSVDSRSDHVGFVCSISLRHILGHNGPWATSNRVGIISIRARSSVG